MSRYSEGEAKAVGVVVDVTDPDQTKMMVDRCLAEFGALDILVNCAGLLTEVPLAEMDVATWDEMISVDLRSVFLCCRWAVPHMLAQGPVASSTSAANWGSKAVSAWSITAPLRRVSSD